MTWKTEERLCMDCRNATSESQGDFISMLYRCRKKLMMVTGEMQVMFEESKGTCWEAREKTQTGDVDA